MSISTTKGMESFLRLLYHDDGLREHGGETGVFIGSLGSGKTTLLMQSAEYAGYVNPGSKYAVVANRMSKGAVPLPYPIEQECVIWRGRDLDYWNGFQTFGKSFPQWEGFTKKVYVHTSAEDRIAFEHIREETIPTQNIPDLPPQQKYASIAELYDHIRQDLHGIHVVYEPRRPYYLRKELAMKLLSQNIEARNPHILDRPILVPKETWWIEFFSEVLHMKGREFLFWVIDEAHAVVPYNPAGLAWHLIGWFATALIDARRQNCSVILSTHSASLIDFRVMDRLTFVAMLPGCTPPKRSMVKPWGIYSVRLGQVIFEEKARQFGIFEFDKIGHAPPLIRVVEQPAQPVVKAITEEDAWEDTVMAE